MTQALDSSGTDRAAIRGQPPLFFLVSLATALAIHYLAWPLRFTFPSIGAAGGSTLRIALGVFLAITGLTMMAAAVVAHKREGNDPSPHSSTRALITSGPHRFTRNPIYLGVGMIQAGVGVAIGSIWVLASVFIALTLAHFMAVLPEEEYLEDKFGDEYRLYKRRVRRWI